MKRINTPEAFTFEHTHNNSRNPIMVSFREVLGFMNITVTDTRSNLLGYIGVFLGAGGRWEGRFSYRYYR